MNKIFTLSLLVIALHYGIESLASSETDINKQLRLVSTLQKAVKRNNVSSAQSCFDENMLFLQKAKQPCLNDLLSHAVRNKSLAMVNLLLKHGAYSNDCIKNHDSFYYPVLIEAVELPVQSSELYNFREEIIRSLLRAGVDVDMTDECGRTALRYAVQNCDNRLARFLLAKKASKDFTTHITM